MSEGGWRLPPCANCGYKPAPDEIDDRAVCPECGWETVNIGP